MRKVLSCACCFFLFAQTATASSGVSFHPAPLKYAKAPLRFSSYGKYLQYNRKKLFEGLDSANAFYKRENEKIESTYTDYLPLTGGTLTGTLSGTDAAFSSTIRIGSTNSILMAQDGSGSWFEQLGTSSSTSVIRFQSSKASDATNYSFFKIDPYNGFSLTTSGSANGNVGIGTTSPSAMLDVRGSALFNQSGTTSNFAVGAYLNSNAFAINGSHLGRIGLGSDVSYTASVEVGGTFDSYFAGGELEALNISSNVEPVNGDGSLLRVAGTLTKAPYGTHTNFSSIKILPPVIVSGASTLTNASSLYITGAPSGATNNFAFRIDDGTVSLGSGNVGIGTTSPSEKLSVNGNISAKKMIVTQSGWSDYVFDKDYKLRSLSSLETFINQNNHLPEIPSAKEVEEKGISVGDNQVLLLKKIEELTLYMIEMNKVNDQMRKEIQQLKKQIKKR